MSTFFSRGQPVMRRSADTVWPLRFSDSDGTRSAAAKTPVPQDCQARAEGIAKIASPNPDRENSHV